MKKTKTIYLALLTVLLSPMAANADLIGSNVDANYHFDDLGDIIATGSTTVSGVIEWESGESIMLGIFESIDFTGSTIIFDYLADACCSYNTSGTYNGYTFEFDAGVLSDLVGLSFAANAYGYVDSMLSWSGDTLFVNWRGAPITDVPGVTIELSFASVPEPGTLALLGIGLVGMAARRRKKV